MKVRLWKRVANQLCSVNRLHLAPLSIGVFSGFTETGTGIRGPLLYPITLFILVTFSVTSFPSPATLSCLPPWPSRVLWPHPSCCLPPCQLSDPTETLNPWDFFLPVVSTFCSSAHLERLPVIHLKIRARLDAPGTENWKSNGVLVLDILQKVQRNSIFDLFLRVSFFFPLSCLFWRRGGEEVVGIGGRIKYS